MKNVFLHFAHPIVMYLGEMALLILSALVMTGLTKGVTARLKMNDLTTTFLLFSIVLLNVRGGVKLTGSYFLAIGGVLSVVSVTFILLRRLEYPGDLPFSLLSMIGNAGIVFAYTLHFSTLLDPKLLSVLLSILSGLWCAFAARKTFASCLFAAVAGGFLGTTFYYIFFQNGGYIGGSYAFSTMWFSAVFGLFIQYLLSVMMRQIKSPRANTYFEASELMDEEVEKQKKEKN